MCGEFNYESNGSFGAENGVGTKKLGRKRENGKWVPATCRRATPSRGPSRGKVLRMFWVYATKVRGIGAGKVAGIAQKTQIRDFLISFHFSS